MSPDQRTEDGSTVRQQVQTKTFAELLEHVRFWRRGLGKKAAQSAFSNFNFKHQIIERDDRTRFVRLYCLGRVVESSDNTLLYVDLPCEGFDASSESTPTVAWRALQQSSDSLMFRAPMTKEEEILRERMRCVINGIISYDFHPQSCSFLFNASSALYKCDDIDDKQPVVPDLVDVGLGLAMDAKRCPSNSSLICFVRNNDLYLQYDDTVTRATFTQEKEDALTAGVACFVTQEEFDRYTGYWWCPVQKDNKYYVLYEEIDESQVQQLSINVPASRSENVELMRYPRAGTPNAKWTLKMLEISLLSEASMNDDEKAKVDVNVVELICMENFRELFPHVEYLVRAGWMPNADGVWIEVMSRTQHRLSLVFVPMVSFALFEGSGGSMEDLSDKRESQVVVLYEDQSDIWINLHDTLTFLEQDEKKCKFLWCSSKSGFSHLYLVEASLKPENVERNICDLELTMGVRVARRHQIISEVQLTSGEWEICRKSEPFVDSERDLVYFLALKDSPIETHIYCVSFQRPNEIRRLTDLGYSHGSPRDARPFQISADSRFFVAIRSNLNEVGKCAVYALKHDPVEPYFPTAELLCFVGDQRSGVDVFADFAFTHESQLNWDVPQLIEFENANTDFTHYAYLFRPPGGCRPGVKYPTILYVYGGPDIQLVRNAWTGHMCMQKYTSLGYVVVTVDGRGSANRGVDFERPLSLSMGTFEIQDQIDVLTFINDKFDCIDLSRVAIFGWSYGGYMSLMGLAQRPDVFKVAVAGAPVTVWQLYDTAYTERYMGVPQKNDTAYLSSSVLSHISGFPDESGRLLMLHGLIDENVHFQHTSMLVSAMIKAGKPYQLQMFPSDRHAVRSSDAGEHMDATILDFFQRNL